MWRREVRRRNLPPTPTLEVARLTGCKNFSRARRVAYGLIEALDWAARSMLRKSSQAARRVAISRATIFACARRKPRRNPRQFVSLLARRHDGNAFPRHTRFCESAAARRR